MTSSQKTIFSSDKLPSLAIVCEYNDGQNLTAHAVISRGHVYTSGFIGVSKDFKLAEGGVQPQTRLALDNISMVLKDAGSGLEHAVKVNIYLANLSRDFQLMNEVYAEFFEKGNMPARTCVGVASLPMGADVEIECIAEIPQA